MTAEAENEHSAAHVPAMASYAPYGGALAEGIESAGNRVGP